MKLKFLLKIREVYLSNKRNNSMQFVYLFIYFYIFLINILTSRFIEKKTSMVFRL